MTDAMSESGAIQSAQRWLAAVLEAVPRRWLLVSVRRQELLLVEDGAVAGRWPVSTAAAGVSGHDGSLATPPGVHVIARKIGAGMPLGTVFRSREPTGEIWRPGDTPAGAAPAAARRGAGTGGPAAKAAGVVPAGEPPDLILTRILTLEGRESGINQGEGCDSLERYIYIHGTNDEARIGRPVSHGCIRLTNAGVIDLFERVAEGDPVIVLPDRPLRFHFAGVGGSGMSALAQYHALAGGRVTGSDRAFDRGERAQMRRQLEAAGVRVTPQDGSGLEAACDALVVSTAVEESVPDVAAARRLGVPILHRAELLARFAAERRTVAVAGTSGKSTVVAMIFEILRGAGRDPSVITGGELLLLQEQGYVGNAWAGAGDLLVIEADESDGSLVRYAPWAGVLLNLQRDHKEIAELAGLFTTFRERTRGPFLAGDDANLDAFAGGAVRFGLGPGAAVRADRIALARGSSRFAVGSARFRLPVPGLHNVANAVAAIAACQALEVPIADMVEPLGAFHGVARRFRLVGRARGVEVIDDFAHNPDKIAAALEAARRRAPRGRVLAVYQPHGFGPTRFLRDALIDAFATHLGPADRLWLPEIFYAGGTVTRDVSSRDIAAGVGARGVPAAFAERREDLLAPIVAEARPGDVVIVMGARDPSLSEFCTKIVEFLRTKRKK